MFPQFNFRSSQQILVYKNKEEVLDKVFTSHELVHCVEIVTDNKFPANPPPLPEFQHVLLKTKAFQDDDAINALFDPSTIFQSLSPLGTGNTMVVRNSRITFVLNQPTYERFGLIGKKYENVHYITIQPDERDKLKLIRKCENVEGLLYSVDTSSLEKYIKKSRPSPCQIDYWTATKPLEFDVKQFEKEETYPADWKLKISDAIDNSLLTRNQLEGRDTYKRITIIGSIKLSALKDWIINLGSGSFVLVTIWDFRDQIASFIGNKLKMDGFGGSVESIVFGDKVARPFKLQTIEYIDEE